MSANEFVVVQVWKAYALTDGKDGRWLDYSRCTAKQAETYISQKMAESGKWRAVHWISKEEVLSERQLKVMAEMVPSQWENRPPTDGDHWTVDVEWGTSDGEARFQQRFVDGWTGPGWLDMINDLAREAKETGDKVESLKLH